jgi:hypothetical protein
MAAAVAPAVVAQTAALRAGCKAGQPATVFR